MEKRKFSADCVHTLLRFQKKALIAFMVDESFNDSEIGKSTLAKHLLSIIDEQFNYNFVIKEFSDPIHKAVATLNNMSFIEYQKVKGDYRNDQIAIAEYYKNKDSNFFVNNLIERTYFEKGVIIPDVRFIEQYGFLLKSGAYIIKIRTDKGKKVEYKKQTRIPVERKAHHTINLNHIDDKEQIDVLVKKIVGFFKVREEKKLSNLMKKELKPKRKRI